MKNLRTHGKSTIVWVLMGLMVLGLGGFGVTSFSGGSSEIGSVGETKITADEYARALQGQMRAYQQQTGQPLSMAQAQAIGLPQAVQGQLITGAALEEQARIIGVSVGDDQVRKTILEAASFRGPNGNFDRTAYGEALRRERMSEAEFESAIRTDEARLLIQRAVAGGVVAPTAMVALTSDWILEQRDLSWRELSVDQLETPIADPDEATLTAWHGANAARFTTPETRKISYLWLTPEMMAEQVQLDEAALRAVYDEHITEYQRPERRIVSRLIFPSQADAEAAKAQIDANEAPFEAFVLQRGLTIEDVDLGEMSQEELGDAGQAVFALEQPGVVGPIQTNLGPALFSMNAILDPVDIPFEDAREDLRSEAAIDRAARLIEDRSAEYEDLLAGGATLEQVAEETDLELGQIEWTATTEPDGRGISGYQAFRDRALEIDEADFPELAQLDDGGIFALRLDEIVAPTLTPFEEVRDEVLADWRRAEQHRLLLSLADEELLTETSATTPDVPAIATTGAAGVVQNPAVPQPETPAPAPTPAPVAEWKTTTGVTRDGWVEGAPPELLMQAFAMDKPGEIEVVDAQNRVLLLRLDAIHAADSSGDDAQRVNDAVASRMGSDLQLDIFDYYARAVQRAAGIELNQTAINAINTQVQ